MNSPEQIARHMERVNRLLQDTDGVGAYCLGMAVGLAYDEGWLPTVAEMQEMLKCRCADEANRVIARLAATHRSGDEHPI